MKAVLRLAALALAAAPAAHGEDRIDRRAEARENFRATAAGLFRHYCGHCHSRNVEGATRRLWPDALNPSPPDLSKTELDREALATFITGGSGAAGRSTYCPPWGKTLDREEITRLAVHVARLSGEERRTGTGEGGPGREGFPWGLLAVLVVECGLLWRFTRKGRGQFPSA